MLDTDLGYDGHASRALLQLVIKIECLGHLVWISTVEWRLELHVVLPIDLWLVTWLLVFNSVRHSLSVDINIVLAIKVLSLGHTLVDHLP